MMLGWLLKCCERRSTGEHCLHRWMALYAVYWGWCWRCLRRTRWPRRACGGCGCMVAAALEARLEQVVLPLTSFPGKGLARIVWVPFVSRMLVVLCRLASWRACS